MNGYYWKVLDVATRSRPVRAPNLFDLFHEEAFYFVTPLPPHHCFFFRVTKNDMTSLFKRLIEVITHSRFLLVVLWRVRLKVALKNLSVILVIYTAIVRRYF